MNSRSSLYDEDRLQRILKSGSGHSVEKVVNSVLEDVWEFQGDAEQADDVTIMAVSYTGSSPEEASKSLALRIENNFEEIEHVNEAFNAFAEAYDIPDTIRRKLNLVFDELLNNIISYGYADDATHWIEIGVSVVEGVLVVSITDDGRPFNPTETPTPNIDVPLEEREVGGLGLHLMKSLMDEVTYERQDTGNLVTLKKRLPFPEE